MKTLHTIYTNFAKRVALVLSLLLTLGVTQVWGALSSPSACVFTSSNSTSLSDDNTDVTWIASTTPSGFESSSDKRGLQWSGSVVNGGLTLSCSSYSSYTITKIEVVWSRNNSAGASVSATVGGKSFGSSDTNNAKTTNRKATFTGSEKGDIVIKATSTATNNSFYIKSITVTYEDVASCKYTVQFKPNGGTGTMSDQTFTCDVEQKLTANSFTKTGHTFAGWATTANGSVAYTDQQLVNLSSINNDNIPLFAQWTPNKYTVNFTASPNGYGTVSQSSIANVPYGTTVTENSNAITINGTTVTATPAAKDANYSYSFNNWSNVPNTITGTCTITANFTRTARALTNYRTTCSNKPSVTLDPNGGTIAPLPDGWNPDGSNYKQEDVTGSIDLPTPTRIGYDFDGWYDGETKVTSPYTPSKTVTLTAEWIAKTTSITLDANTNNNGSGENSSVTATYDQALPEFTACTAATGYTLNGYYTAATNGTMIIDKEGEFVSDVAGYTSNEGKWNNESAKLTLYAQYKINSYTVTFDDQGHGIKPDDQIINHGGKVNNPGNLTANGFIFGGWYKEAECTNAWNFETDVVTSNITIYAKWTAKIATSLSWSAATYSATIDADNEFPILTKSPADLSPIAYSSSNTNVATIDADGNITLKAAGTTDITATFTETATHAVSTDSYTLTVNPSNCRWVEAEIGDIQSGDEVVITMTSGLGVTYALPSNQSTGSNPQAITVEIDGNCLKNNASTQYVWIINKDGENLTFESLNHAGYVLNCTNENDGVRVSSGSDKKKIFVIDPTSGYLKNTQTTDARYLGVHNTNYYWYCYTTYGNNTGGQTLKFYKKECIASDEYWIIYNLENVTCNSEMPNYIGTDGEIELYFSANSGYKLPEQVSITMGGNTLPEDDFAWEAEEGLLLVQPTGGITGDIVITIEGCELLAIPTNLKADDITSSSATLSWDEIDHATEYQVHITDDDDSTEDIITTTSNTYYEVTGLSSASVYLWGVTPVASGYCGLKQEAEIFTTLDVYTVTFNSDGGTDVAPQNVDHGTKATKPANPTKTGYTFAGWYTEADAEFDFNTPIESATTLYAKWNANQYTITFLKQWGDGGTGTATVHFDNNDFSVSPIIVPTRNGYTFGGYYTAESGVGTQLIDVSGAWLNAPTYIEGGKWVYADNLKLYAKWTQNFTITWMANGQPYHTQTAMMGTAIAKPDDPDANEFACDDKVFVGWLDKTISGSTNEEPTFVTDFGTIQANKTYYAVFAKLTGTPSNDYNQITDINDLTDGEYVIAYGYNTSSPSIILKAEAKDATKLAATSLAPTNNKYTSPAAANIWEIKKNGDNYSIYNAATQKYVEATTTPSVGLSDNPEYYTISWNSSYSYWKIQIANSTHYWFVGYIQGETKYFQSYNVDNDRYRIQLYKNASTAVYSDYVTTCVEIPTPHWEGAEIDNANIAVDCGAISYKTNASTITFPTDKNYDLTYPITLTASEGFLLSTNKQNNIYEQSVTVTPVQSGDNKGKITQSVYVRADATGKNTNFDGTITISGDQLTEDQIIEVHAVVDCPQYTLTFNDCGDTKTITDFAGTSVEEMEPWAGICSEPFQYVFDGWATEPVTNGTEAYEKVDFSTFTMPNNNTTTLYAVYRYAEEGGEPVNGYVKVTEALADWSGDYVIVDDEFNVAIQNTYEEDTENNKTLKDVSVTIENDKIVSPTNDIIWTISKYGEYYTVYNAEAIKYAGITKNETRAAGLSETIAKGYSMNIIFDSNTKIAKVSSIDYNRCFSYSESYSEWRTYSNNDAKGKTGYLYRFSNKTIRYTSSLVCGTIEAEDAIVTSTVGQTVKVYVPITLEYSDVASITGTSDNEAFTVVTKNDVAVGESTIEVHYKPTAYVNTANQEETATITLTTSNGATTTFNVTGRCLPETFAIVAKVGNVWYALPSQGLNSGTTPVGYPVEVDNNDNPTAVTSLPTKAKWALRNVYKVNGPNDRFAANGENLVFVNAENKTLYANNGNANIQTYAEYTNYAANNPDCYEWVPTTDLTNYTLKNVESAKNLSINVNATFGTHASNVASNNLRFLPINVTYNPFDMQVVEWYPTKVLVQTEAALTSVSATVGGVAVASPVVTKKGGKLLYEISGLPLENNPTKILTISYDSYSCNKVIPIIISRATKSVTEAPFTTLTTSVYNYSDLVVRDGAVLNITGAKNTPDKFVNVTIYPTAKIVVPENNQLSVYTLTFFGGIDDIYDGEKYTTNKYGVPQLSLKGTLGKTVTTMDYIMRVNLDQMYQVGVPYDVNLNEITYWDGTIMTLGDDLYISAYDGQARANRESKTWIWETDFAEKLGSATLKPGIGYTISAEPQSNGDEYSILRMPMKSNIASGSSEEAKTINVVAYDNEKGVTITANHKGWNYLSNPYMAAISGAEADSKLVVGYLRETGTGPWEWVNDEIRYVTIPHNDGEDYDQQKFSEATLLPFKSFFLQIATGGELSFALANRQPLPARILQQENAPREVEFEILLANDTRSDNMGLLIGEDYTPAYEINADLEKMIGSMSVYTIYNGYNLAYNALSPINAQEQIPIGYVVPDVGEYTFKLDENADVENIEHIYLNDFDMNVVTDLLENEYTFYASEKKSEARFVINVIMRSEQEDDTPTGLEELEINTNQPIKFIHQDRLYILRDGVIYDATGQEIQTINK